MSKTERIEFRADPAQQARIQEAARLVNQSMSAFTLTAAVERADEIVATWTTTTVPPEFFDRLTEALDRPPRPNAALARAAKRRVAGRR